MTLPEIMRGITGLQAAITRLQDTRHLAFDLEDTGRFEIDPDELIADVKFNAQEASAIRMVVSPMPISNSCPYNGAKHYLIVLHVNNSVFAEKYFGGV